MSWGLQTRDTSGVVKLTQDSKLCRLLGRFLAVAGKNGSGKVDVSGASNVNFLATLVSGDAENRHIPHEVTMSISSGTATITWTKQSFNTSDKLAAFARPAHGDTLILVFGYG